MKVDIVSRSGELWSGNATSVTVPAFDGELGILPGREPVLAVTRPGTVRIVGEDGQDVTIDVPAGFVTVDSDIVTLVVDEATEGSLNLKELDEKF